MASELQSRAGDTNTDYLHRTIEASIHVALLILFVTVCLVILRPFVPMLAWGIIIAIAVYPAFRKLHNLLRGRSGLAAVICTLLLFAILILPVVLLAGSLVGGIQSLAARLNEGMSIIPPPPPRVATWPVFGERLKEVWELASKNLGAVLRTFAPQIRPLIPKLLLASAGVGLTVLQWILSILVAGFLLANAATGAKLADSFATRIFGDEAPRFEELAAATIRSVTTGIIGVAFIQSFFAALGFLVAGLPGAGLWALMFLIAAVLQVGGLLLIPAVIYMFAIASTSKALIFLVWCVIVGLLDNVLKPLLLGRGVAVPMVVVFLGAIGGVVTMGTIGLFVGAIALSVGYRLLLAWVEGSAEIAPEMPARARFTTLAG